MKPVIAAMIATLLATLLMSPTSRAQTPDPSHWKAVVAAARGQTVYLDAWAGEPHINQYLAWAGRQVQRRYGIKLEHVKLSDTSQAVARVVAEKQAGNHSNGAVDMIWINGENFAAMKKQGLLFGPWADRIPNYSLTDPQHNPAVREDFTVPVDGMEAPWNKAQLVFYYDSSRVKHPPKTMPALSKWVQAHPGQFTYPKPPNFLGTTFLKQALLGLASSKKPLYSPVKNTDFKKVTAPLWRFLDKLKPDLWRKGRAFPANSAAMRRLMGDGETTLAFSFDPAGPASAIDNGQLPPSVRTYVLKNGTIGNVSFMAIPYNASHKAAAMVVANFLLSPKAQAHKQDPEVWGGSTVLAMDKLSPSQRKLFSTHHHSKAILTAKALGKPLQEPNPSWMDALEEAWAKRYVH